jgi:formylglycine-generating enzyme required for sulfatase activity
MRRFNRFDLPVCLMGGAVLIGDIGTYLMPAHAASSPPSRCPPDMVPTGTGTCIDRREWPSGEDHRPLVGASGLPEPELPVDESADTLCRSAGKRVCERDEWMSACSRGEKYPYGDRYAPGSCNDARSWKDVDEAKVAHRDRREIERLNGSEPSGARAECRSPSGAFDMVGNVEEWVRCREGTFGWCLVGGYWASQGAKTCSSAILKHAPRWHYYQTGFRCCSEEER